ncbi:MAG: hypothetical protein Q8R28_16695 [Dehalococcoidia bacterium]|nr:hypothetical protein [Dehalococcoidia bacterium]
MEGPITKDTIVEHIIKTYPKALGFLVSKRVDCCCGAYNTIEKGASEVGADLQAILTELNAIAAEPSATAAKKGR